MTPDDAIRNRDELLMRAIAALDARLLTNTADPFISADGSIAGLPRPYVFPAARKDVLAPTEKRSEKRNLDAAARGGSYSRCGGWRTVFCRMLALRRGQPA